MKGSRAHDEKIQPVLRTIKLTYGKLKQAFKPYVKTNCCGQTSVPTEGQKIVPLNTLSMKKFKCLIAVFVRAE